MVPLSNTVAIVGGGPVGLVSSILLSLQGIDHVLFERQPGTSIHPKAVGLNQRTMEVFRQIGVEDEIFKQSAPPVSFSRTAWYTSFGPEGREIAARYAWGGGPYAEKYEKASPSPYANLPQIRLEPILKRRASELNPKSIYFYHEVVDIEEQPDRVLVHWRDRNEGDTIHTLTAKYVLGADGGRFIADRLGLEWNGESDIIDMVSAHFRAPLSKHTDPTVFISWFTSPELGGSLKTGYLYHLGPYPMRDETSEWMFACARLPHEMQKPFTEEDMLSRIHQVLKVPDLEVDMISLSHWYVNAKVVERYRSRSGRVFLVGDGAHRIPPWGALGLNSGVQDAENLIWKLAMSLRQPANLDWNRLLDSYDAERRAIGERVSSTSLYNMRAHAGVLDRALGLTPEHSLEENVRAMDQYFDLSDVNEGEAKRKAVAKALIELDVEFYAHGAEVGWFYPYPPEADEGRSTMQNGDHHPQMRPNGEMELLDCHPTTKPGHQLPHAWLVNDDGVRMSTRDLVKRDKLVLITTSSIWSALKHPLVEVVLIGDAAGRWHDVDGRWAEQCGAASELAVLVRPDKIVGYRSQGHVDLTQSNLAEQANMMVQTALKLQP